MVKVGRYLVAHFCFFSQHWLRLMFNQIVQLADCLLGFLAPFFFLFSQRWRSKNHKKKLKRIYFDFTHKKCVFSIYVTGREWKNVMEHKYGKYYDDNNISSEMTCWRCRCANDRNVSILSIIYYVWCWSCCFELAHLRLAYLNILATDDPTKKK